MDKEKDIICRLEWIWLKQDVTRSEDNKIYKRIWKIVEKEVEETKTIKAKEKREKKRRRKEARRKKQKKKCYDLKLSIQSRKESCIEFI